MILKHTDDATHMCEAPGCEWSIATEKSIPDSEKIFVCSFQNCGTKWSNQFMLEQHYHTHVHKKSQYEIILENISNSTTGVNQEQREIQGLEESSEEIVPEESAPENIEQQYVAKTVE